MTKISCVLPAINQPSHVHRTIACCHMLRWLFSSFTWLWIFLTEIVLVCRSLLFFDIVEPEVSFQLTLKNIVTVLLSCLRQRGSIQAHHLLVIFENFKNYLERNWEYLEQNWIFLEHIWRFRRATVDNAQRSENREYFTTIQTSLWYAMSLFSGQGEIVVFYRTVVSSRGHIFASIEKFGLHVWNVANESLVTYTDFFVSLVHSWLNSTREWRRDQPRSRCCW